MFAIYFFLSGRYPPPIWRTKPKVTLLWVQEMKIITWWNANNSSSDMIKSALKWLPTKRCILLFGSRTLIQELFVTQHKLIPTGLAYQCSLISSKWRMLCLGQRAPTINQRSCFTLRKLMTRIKGPEQTCRITKSVKVLYPHKQIHFCVVSHFKAALNCDQFPLQGKYRGCQW